jgi:hypothetical protein
MSTESGDQKLRGRPNDGAQSVCKLDAVPRPKICLTLKTMPRKALLARLDRLGNTVGGGVLDRAR